jgi:hypothetical protein
VRRDNSNLRWVVCWTESTAGNLRHRFFYDIFPKNEGSSARSEQCARLFVNALKMCFPEMLAVPIIAAVSAVPEVSAPPPPEPVLTAKTKNKTGVRGLTRDEPRKRWTAKWTDTDTGRRKYKIFSDTNPNYGNTKEGSYKAAFAFLSALFSAEK